MRRRAETSWRRAGGALLMAMASVWITGLPAGPALGQDLSLEYAIKANFLYKFGPFVAWPAETFGTPESPFTVCIAGRDPFGRALDEAVRGQTVEGRAVTVRRLQSVSHRPPCHVLYVGRGPQPAAEALLAAQGAPVLTVTDERAGTAGGMVHFVLRQGRVRFGVNENAARSSGLSISSKLLSLAVPITKTGG